jgi:hypothetical protein
MHIKTLSHNHHNPDASKLALHRNGLFLSSSIKKFYKGEKAGD